MSPTDDLYFSEPPRPPREVPKKGLVPAVLAFAEDLGMAVSFDRTEVEHKVVLVFETAQPMSDGRPFMASRTYKVSFWEKAPFYKAVCALLGVDALTEAQKAKLPRSELIGRSCMLNLVHKERKAGGLRADIESVLPPIDGQAALAVQASAPPKWVEAQRLTNASEVARFYSGEPPHEDEGGESAAGGGIEEVPFAPFDAPF
jgi:hypothetical protein